MIVKLSIPDDIAIDYQDEAAGKERAIEEILVERLIKALPLDPHARTIILQDRSLARLEECLGGLQIPNVEALLARVNRLAVIKFGEREIHLSPAQYEELVHRAHVNGKDLDQMLQEITNKWSEGYFNYVP